ncbi:MAG: DUF58 domain-containing protein [Proteobacteria bacterium]|nr:DUF58 domain-containing protein [Pseudomonadota bacterium]
MANSPSSIALEQLINPTLLAEARRLELRSTRAMDSDTVGQFRSSFRGSGLTFAELREYEPGDDIRRIDWKATARSPRIYIKSYLEERSLSILLALDSTRSTCFGNPQTRQRRALEFSALITLLARYAGDAVGLLRFSDIVEEYIRPERRRTQAQRIITSLLQPRELSTKTDLTVMLRDLRTTLRRRTVIFIVSDFLSPPFFEPLQMLCKRHDVICVHLGSPAIDAFPAVGIVAVQDAESNEQIVVDSGSKRGQALLRELQLRQTERIQQSCRSAGADWIELVDHPLRPLRDLMRQRTRRQR